jgi:hypothetical protein
MKKLYEILNGDVTVYVKWQSKNFQFMGFTVCNDRKNYYVEYESKYDSLPNDRTAVEIGKYLYNLYKNEADAQLEKYIENNITNYDFYSKCKDNSFPFWDNILSTAGIMPVITPNYDIDLTDMMDGIVKLLIGRFICTYNFAEQKTIGFVPKNIASESITSAMEIFYNEKIINEMLALEQYKRGVGVPAYGELVRLREFLQEKKSVKIVLTNKRNCIQYCKINNKTTSLTN